MRTHPYLNMNSLSVVIITFNEENNIERCINSVKALADEIIILDSFSTDNTIEIAKKMGAIVKQQKFLSYIEQKNCALKYAKHNYVLCLDADEALDETLKKSIYEAKNNFSFSAYKSNRCTNFCGQFIRFGSWYPDKKIRLFDKRFAKWGGINPHDKIELTIDVKKVKYLKGDILHYSFSSIKEQLIRNEVYSTISAASLFEIGIESNWYKIVINPLWTFFFGYVIRFGFLDGYYGFIIALNSARATLQKYMKLYRLQNGSVK